MSGKVKKVFPGGNTSEGFFSFYDYMIDKDTANRIFVIKGGPGVGKSSMMKRIGQEFAKRGYDVELHFCSSDNNSIDGVVIPKLKVALVDGTAPHVIDPKNPGAVDEIINLGEYWDQDKMEQVKEDVLKTTKQVSRYFLRAYKFLQSCRPIVLDIQEKYKEAMDYGKVNFETSKLIEEVFENVPYRLKFGKARHLFGSAITPNGHVEITESILQGIDKIYYIKGEVGTGKSTLLERIYNQALLRGIDVEVYHAPLIPQKLETVVIESLKVAFTTSNLFKENNYKTIDLNEYLDKNIIKKYEEEIEYDKKILNELFNKGIENVKNAKKEHDVLEKYYVSNMDFEGIEKLRYDIVERILKYAK
ncbi:hypothetical protein SAMN05661008_00093 [Alkalithermobacter thermoalcaliphilus JW-YL-7 = DSM 7308]|uniref:ATP/GTP-binding protein n=1 Tax=Alkalithermobacter thermoalcaliphilus JW-YL-7 = DSM 7308 TaxID=1121328 RepID=A0A150FRV8_CLOPD|nr:ATP/GTP-binding protein [[Clostridium] paradoxum JW-YL-7 = DSM 7308]SHK36659.1 hypothetical protein SAMN05661008_00093 [[Clostridium] paradoxum JW-YL-7 = DSM 7308]